MSGRLLSIKACLVDGRGTATRLFNDIDRFGLDLIDFRFSSDVGGQALVRFSVSAADDLDKDQVRARFERHPSVSCVRIVEGERTR